MIQFATIIIVFAIVLFYLVGKKGKQKPRNEVDSKCEFYREEIVNFIKRVKSLKSKTRLKRLEIEMKRFRKAMQLDEILERAEKENNPAKAIDYYLEALSFILKNKFEPERKTEIEEKIKILQEDTKSRAYK